MRSFYTTISLLTISIFFTGLAWAEVPSETTQETLTVTANKMEENIQKVPIAITAIDGYEIEDMNISSLGDLTDYVPNMMLFQHGPYGVNTPTVRGIQAPLYTNQVAAGMFIDGVPVLSAVGFDDSLLDIERIEILRGPQGTLYGKNTEVGAINIISRLPDNTFQGKVSADVGEDNKRVGTLSMTGPIVKDQLYFGLTGQYYTKDGYIDHGVTGEPVNDQESWYGRGQLRWTPSDALDIQFIATMLERDDGAGNMVPLSGDAPAPDVDEYNKSENQSQSLKISYDITDSMILTSISTRWVYDDIRSNDYDFTQANVVRADNDRTYETLSQELRLNGSTDRMQWVTGLYYDRNDTNNYNVMSGAFPSDTTDRDLKSDTYAVFGQLRYALTEKMGVTGGLRYERKEEEVDDHSIRDDDSWEDISPKFSLDYAVTPEIMGYATVAKGYRSGGFSIEKTVNPDYLSYDEEELWSYEIGAKSQFFNNRLFLNTALFYMDIDNMQMNESIVVNGANRDYITNAAKASGYGAEIDMRMLVTTGLNLFANFGFSDIEFDEFSDAKGDYKGNKNTYSPAYTFSVGAKYRMGNGFYAGADVVSYGKMYFDRANNDSRDSYELVNAKIGYEAESWDVYLYGKNIFDKEYNSYNYFGGFCNLYSEPREVGVKLSYRF
ncbi:MAG: TonB-dependent receptor [Desulfobacteraceae bacterium]|nr:TonB-dependent receptor [Desulfobacteraceae bacterium]